MARPRKVERLMRGRPKKKIDIETVEKLAALNCSSEEIADWFDVNKRTIERRFMPHLKKGRSQGRISLKRKMFEMAMAGNCTMAIWLSKQMLGYTDKIEQDISGKHSFNITDEQASHHLDKIVGRIQNRKNGVPKTSK